MHRAQRWAKKGTAAPPSQINSCGHKSWKIREYFSTVIAMNFSEEGAHGFAVLERCRCNLLGDEAVGFPLYLKLCHLSSGRQEALP